MTERMAAREGFGAANCRVHRTGNARERGSEIDGDSTADGLKFQEQVIRGRTIAVKDM